MRVAILVESWGEPWNEGYKNLARYVVEMLRDLVSVHVFAADKVKVQSLVEFDLIHIYNYAVPFHLFAPFAQIKRPIVKHVAKKELDTSTRSVMRAIINTKFLWDALIATTRLLKLELERFTKPVFYLPPPIPTSYFRKLDRNDCRKLLGLESDTVYLGYTGTVNKFRNLGVLTKILRLINDRKVKLAISITNGASERLAELKMLLSTDRVKLVKVKDVRHFYSAVDLLVYPVERGGAVEPPLTVLEAMSSQCIVATLKNSVTSKLILNGYNGFTFSCLEDLCRIVYDLLRGKFNAEAMTENARRAVVRVYDSSMLRKQYTRLYEKLVETL